MQGTNLAADAAQSDQPQQSEAPRYDHELLCEIRRIGFHPFILLRTTEAQSGENGLITCLTQNEVASFIQEVKRLPHFGDSKLICAIVRALIFDIGGAADLLFSWTQERNSPATETAFIGVPRGTELNLFYGYPAFALNSGPSAGNAKLRMRLIAEIYQAYAGSDGNNASRLAIMDALAVARARALAHTGSHTDALAVIDRALHANTTSTALLAAKASLACAVGRIAHANNAASLRLALHAEPAAPGLTAGSPALIPISMWFQGKQFTSDWTSNNFSIWTKILAPWRDRPLDVLEIGSWEGRSAVFWLEYLPSSRVVCVDSFDGGEVGPIAAEVRAQMPFTEARFDANLASYAGRFEKIALRSVTALDRLRARRRSFDLIYIDGGHTRDEVLIDSLLSWAMLKRRGILIWDDYEWRPELPIAQRPKDAIDTFLRLQWGNFTERHRGYQVIIEKLDRGPDGDCVD